MKACGYRQLILNARAEKNVRMQRLCQGISTEVDIGKRVMVFYSSSVAENVSIARKGEKGRGKIQKGSRDRSLMANVMEKKEHEIHFIQVKDVSLLLFIYRLAQLCIVLHHIKIESNQNRYRDNIRMHKNSEKRETFILWSLQ